MLYKNKSYWLLILFICTCLFAKSINIQADHLIYLNNYLISASGNVELAYTDIQLKANKVELDTRTNTFLAFGNVSVNFQGHSFNTDKVVYDIKDEEVVFSCFSATLNPKEFSEPIYFYSQTISKNKNFYAGTDTIFSTCPPGKQYYQIQASRFEFYPNDKIIGYNVICKTGIIPVFYTPYYEFQIGKKNPILLFPAIGSNQTEGNYIKTTTLYNLNRDLHTKILIDNMQNFGWGLGIAASINRYRNNPAELYLYYIDNSRYATKFDQKIISSPKSSFEYGINRRSMSNLYGSFENFTDGYFRFNNYSFGDLYFKQKLDDYYNQASRSLIWSVKIDNTNYFFNHNFKHYLNSNQRENYFLLGGQNNYLNNSLSYQQSLKDSQNHYHNWNNNFKMNVDSQTVLSSKINYKDRTSFGKRDQLLNPMFNLNYNMKETYYLKSIDLNTNHYLDLDNDNFTLDARETIVETKPEINFNFNTFYLSPKLQYTPRLSLGLFYENKYLPAPIDYIRKAEHARVVADNIFYMPLLSNQLFKFDIKYNYSQYLYDTQDKQYGLDEFYGLDLLPSFPLKNRTIYRQYHNQGNTPFYFDELNVFENKKIDNQVIWDITTKQQINIYDGYSYTSQRRDPQRYSYNYNISKESRLNLNTAYDYENNTWQNLYSNYILRKDALTHLTWTMSYNLMHGFLQDTRIRGGVAFGELKDRLIINSELIWNIYDQKYRIPYINITKELECIELIYNYYDLRHEHTFLIRVNAFEDMPLGASFGDDGLNLKGWKQQDVTR